MTDDLVYANLVIMAYRDPLDPRARASRRKHYKLNREQYYRRNLEKRAKLRQHVVDLKNEGACVGCTAEYPGEPWLFEFDHARGEKREAISAIILRGSWKALKEELAKCDLLCLICHRRRTADRGEWQENRFAEYLPRAVDVTET